MTPFALNSLAEFFDGLQMAQVEHFNFDVFISRFGYDLIPGQISFAFTPTS